MNIESRNTISVSRILKLIRKHGVAFASPVRIYTFLIRRIPGADGTESIILLQLRFVYISPKGGEYVQTTRGRTVSSTGEPPSDTNLAKWKTPMPVGFGDFQVIHKWDSRFFISQYSNVRSRIIAGRSYDDKKKNKINTFSFSVCTDLGLFVLCTR